MIDKPPIFESLSLNLTRMVVSTFSNGVNAVDKEGNTALIRAAQQDQFEQIEALLSTPDIDVNAA